VQEDVAYQQKAGYAKVISCKDLQKIAAQAVEDLPTSCRTATERRGHIILDLSFAIRARRNNRKTTKRGQTKRGTQEGDGRWDTTKEILVYILNESHAQANCPKIRQTTSATRYARS
jgi:hypothetical protein